MVIGNFASSGGDFVPLAAAVLVLPSLGGAPFLTERFEARW